MSDGGHHYYVHERDLQLWVCVIPGCGHLCTDGQATPGHPQPQPAPGPGVVRRG